MKNYKEEALKIYYASDVVNKELTMGCGLRVGIESNTFTITLLDQEIFTEPSSYTNEKYIAKGGTDQWVRLSDKATTNIREIIGHPPTLADWLRGIRLNSECVDFYDGSNDSFLIVSENSETKTRLHYNLTKSGDEQDESFYRSYCEIAEDNTNK